MALEINSEWNIYNKENNHMAEEDKTLYVGEKNKRAEGKHVYEDINKRWTKNNG